MRGNLHVACMSLLVAASSCGFGAGGTADDGNPPDAPPIDSVIENDAAPTGPYPIVLAHGMFGFASLGPLDYFYGIPAALEVSGRKVYAKRVDAVQSAEVRGQQLLAIVDAVRAETGAEKVVIIGHSQGGLDARWVANHDPAHIAAVVTVATPHRGSPVADVAGGFLPGNSSVALDVLANLFGLSPGSGASFAGALASLSTQGASSFNAATPDALGVAYYSIAGRSALAGAGACPTGAGAFMHAWDSEVDPLKVELLPVAAILSAATFPATPTQDGLVTVGSATWGTFLGCIPADHLDQVCQVAGQSAGFGNDFDCLGFWTGLEQYLRTQSL